MDFKFSVCSVHTSGSAVMESNTYQTRPRQRIGAIIRAVGDTPTLVSKIRSRVKVDDPNHETDECRDQQHHSRNLEAFSNLSDTAYEIEKCLKMVLGISLHIKALAYLRY